MKREEEEWDVEGAEGDRDRESPLGCRVMQ